MRCVITAVVLVAAGATLSAQAQNWPSFRGANAAGTADGKPTAVKWNAATGEKAFKAIGAPVNVTLQVEGDKVVSFTLIQGTNPPLVFTRVEGK